MNKYANDLLYHRATRHRYVNPILPMDFRFLDNADMSRAFVVAENNLKSNVANLMRHIDAPSTRDHLRGIWANVKCAMGKYWRGFCGSAK